ncbi:MAG: carbohydrate porin [Terracidiphilus sp.]|nr:carbohydrate porin [Terracidiphilus sp.]
MRDKTHRTKRMVTATLLLGLGAGVTGWAQAAKTEELADPPAPVTDATEAFNYVGGDAAMPPFSDSVIDLNSGFRRALFRQGISLRVITQVQYAQDMVNGPVPAQEQTYIGQRAFESAMVQPILTADLRQLHLRQAQLYAGAVWNWVSWNPAGPKTLQLWDMYLYKAFGEDRVEVKAGYVSNGLDFVGFFVGGTTAAGAQGVYAILPYEVGMSYFPMSTPSLNVRIHGPHHIYFTTAAQRSQDPKGGPTEVARNHTGFRFIPKGDKLLSINEGGYLRGSSADKREVWFRAGYMHNSTAYFNAATGGMTPGNMCVYALMDVQVTQTSREHANRGWYVGGSAETASEKLNPYARYYEGRLYKEAPFRSRPGDTASVVFSRTNNSKYFTDALVAQGKTVSHAATTLTGSYNLHAARGNYVSLGLSYVHGPAISPSAPDALKVMVSWNLFL